MGTDRGGYLTNPEKEWTNVKNVIEASIATGIYVIVDWHIIGANPNKDKVKIFSNFYPICSIWLNKINLAQIKIEICRHSHSFLTFLKHMDVTHTSSMKSGMSPRIPHGQDLVARQ